MVTFTQSRFEGRNFRVYRIKYPRISKPDSGGMTGLCINQPLLEGLGVFCQNKNFGIVDLFIFRRMRVVKMVIQFTIRKMPGNKVGIDFQSRRMITALMLMSVNIPTMVVSCFGVVMDERK